MPSRLFCPILSELQELRGCLDNPPTPSQVASLTASGLSPHGALSAAGAPISVGCLVMAIPDEAGGVYKVAVRTQHPDVSKALMAVLQNALSA